MSVVPCGCWRVLPERLTSTTNGTPGIRHRRERIFRVRVGFVPIRMHREHARAVVEHEIVSLRIAVVAAPIDVDAHVAAVHAHPSRRVAVAVVARLGRAEGVVETRVSHIA